MLKNLKKFSILFLTSIFLFSSVEANWITKKSDKSKEVIKEEKKQKSKWIKHKEKEIKKNKEEFKKNKKKISSDVKKWITKKSKKDIYIESVKTLPKAEFYLTAQNTDKDKIIYGYFNFLNIDKELSRSNGDKIFIKGKSFINDGKTICNIGIDVDVSSERYLGILNGNCNNKAKFNGVVDVSNPSNKNHKSEGLLTSSNGEKYIFELFGKKNKAVKNFAMLKSNSQTLSVDKTNSQPLIASPKVNINPTGKYYALLIGNSNYTHWSSLKSPINDVNQIGKILKNDYNFTKVITVKDSNRENIFNALENINSITTDKDYVLIYYSGHGSKVKTSVKTEAYWIPINGKKKFDSNWVNIKDVENYLQDNQAYHMAVMVDSCFFPNLTKGGSKNDGDVKKNLYTKLFNKKSRVILAAGLNEEVADTVGTNSISVFAKTFINALNNNTSIIPLRDIANDIINAHVSLDQTPDRRTYKNWGHNGGSFMFVKKK